jgi:ABC-2 type transport system permease protein
VHAIPAVFRTALRDALANRRSFWVQIGVMLANDLAWVAFWLLFFGAVGSLRGWDAQRVLLLFAVLTTTAGISLGLLGNARRIGQLIADEQLDAVLALPVAPLPYLLARRVDTVMLGDLVFGPILFVASGNAGPQRALVFVLGSLCGAAVLSGFLVAVGALTFFVGGRGHQSDLGFQAILILSSYPLDVFGGATKLLLYTAVPAAFVTGLPTSLVNGFDARSAGLLVGAAAATWLVAATLFGLGLRRYVSGSALVRSGT